MDVQYIFLALFIAFLWAINTIIYKYCMNKSINHKTVLVIGAFTYFVCMCIFTAYHYDEISKDIRKTNTEYILFIGLGAIIGTFIATILFMYLLEKNNSAVLTTLTYTSPIFVLLFAILVLEEKITMIQIIGILITIIGVLMISNGF